MSIKRTVRWTFDPVKLAGLIILLYAFYTKNVWLFALGAALYMGD